MNWGQLVMIIHDNIGQVCAVVGVVIAWRIHHKVQEVRVSINGNLTKLVEVSYARGRAEGAVVALVKPDVLPALVLPDVVQDDHGKPHV